MANRNITAHCLQGQPLPSNWKQLAAGRAKQADDQYLDRLQNAWKQAGSNAQQNQTSMRAARLTTDAVDPAHNAHQSRFDGQMVLQHTDDAGFETWRDTVTGAIIRRRLTWRDVFGEK